MSQLSQVLEAYAVPLQIWLSPESKKYTATTIISAFENRADIHTNPLSRLDDIKGPAVLIITANELTSPRSEDLKRLVNAAHPGRAILIGGTSDRDILMTAINDWGVIRVLPSQPESERLVAAVHDAESYLKREVALVTAIDDLDIENTMLESAIDHLEGGIERTRTKSRHSAITTFSDGLSVLLERERSILSTAKQSTETYLQDHLTRSIRGFSILGSLLDKTHDRSVEQSAGLSSIPEALDDLVRSVCEIICLQDGKVPGGHLGSGALVSVEPLALAHVLIQIADRGPLGRAIAVDSYRSGEHAVLEFRFEGPVTTAMIDDHINTRSWAMLAPLSPVLNVVDADPHILRLSLKAVQDHHDQ